MAYKLTVLQAFGPYAVGDDITGEEAMAAALASHAPYLVQTLADRPDALDETAPPPVRGRGPRSA